MVTKGQRWHLVGCFLKCLETSPFCWRWFCMYAINRFGHAFLWTWNIFMNGTLILTIYSTCSFTDAMFSSGNFGETFFAPCLSHTRRALLRGNLHISVFRACTSCPKVASESSGTKASATLWKIQKGRVFFAWMRKSGTFERLSVFPERAIDFHDFQKQVRWSRNSRHVWHSSTATVYREWMCLSIGTKVTRRSEAAVYWDWLGLSKSHGPTVLQHETGCVCLPYVSNHIGAQQQHVKSSCVCPSVGTKVTSRSEAAVYWDGFYLAC